MADSRCRKMAPSDLVREIDLMDCDSVDEYEVHTCQNEISWLDFYKAIVSDDGETVRKAIKSRDYRLQIEDGKSGLEVAVKMGSRNVVNVILEDIKREHDTYEQYRVLVHACFSACNGQQADLLRLLLKAIVPRLAEWHETIHFLGIYEKAVENCSTELMDILESFTTIDTKEMALVRRAFINGKRNIFLRLFAVGGRTALGVANELPVPVLLIYIALGDQEHVRRLLEIDLEWYLAVPFGDDGVGNSTTELNAFGVAGNFCDIEILDILYAKAQETDVPDLESILEKNYKHALFHDGVQVVKWLVDREITELKMPYEVDVDCSHCYPHIDPHGLVFKYIEEMGKETKLSDEAKMEKVMKVIYDVVAHGSPKLVDWYLGQVPMSPTLALNCLKASVAFDRPLFVERFLKHVDFDCDDDLDTVHEVLHHTLQCAKKRNRRLPSPVITEQILDRLPRGSTCKCGESVLFDLFLDMDYAGGHSHRGEDILPFNVTCRHIRILISQMVSNGARPKLKTVKRALFNFLSNTGASSLETCFGARVIWLFDWYDISQLVKPFKIDQCAIWFIRKFEDRDAVLSELLQSLCGAQETRLRWDGLLVYVMNPDARRRQFLKCINEFGLTISDKYMSKVSDELKRSQAYKDVVELMKPRLLSLQSLARIEIYRSLRAKTTKYRKNHDDFVPLCETVSIWAEAKGIPKPMRDFMNFKDCFDLWNDTIEPHIHESVRDLVFDVSEVLFLHPQLRNTTEDEDE